jgi:hypothetical protein
MSNVNLGAYQQNEGPSKCTWSLNNSSNSPSSPHPIIPVRRDIKIMDSILDNIGNTPLVKINKITKEEGIQCEVCKYILFIYLSHCEFTHRLIICYYSY